MTSPSSGLLTKIAYVHFISPVATCPIHHILLNMIMLIFGVAPHYAIIGASH